MPEAMPAGFHEAGENSVEPARGSRSGFHELRGERFGCRVRGAGRAYFIVIAIVTVTVIIIVRSIVSFFSFFYTG